MKKEVKIFFTALMFFTRIPVPKSTGYSEENLNKATRYFPIVGILVGSFSAFVFYGFQFILPKEVALLLSMTISIYITGAFHEDGFADFCDGFGGGDTKEKIFAIMKDSRIGTYGTIGLILILLVKFFSVISIETASIPLILIAAYSFSRVFPVILIYTAPYSRMDASSKTKPIGKKGTTFSIIFVIITGFAFLYFIHWMAIAVAFVISFSVFFIFRAYVLRKIDGYTGDVLGALQQLSEISFYISYLIHLQTLLWI